VQRRWLLTQALQRNQFTGNTFDGVQQTVRVILHPTHVCSGVNCQLSCQSAVYSARWSGGSVHSTSAWKLIVVSTTVQAHRTVFQIAFERKTKFLHSRACTSRSTDSC